MNKIAAISSSENTHKPDLIYLHFRGTSLTLLKVQALMHTKTRNVSPPLVTVEFKTSLKYFQYISEEKDFEVSACTNRGITTL